MYNKLKEWFPVSYRRMRDITDLLVGIAIYVVLAVFAGAVIWLAGAVTGWIPLIGQVIGWALGIAGGLVELYVLAGILLLILYYKTWHK